MCPIKCSLRKVVILFIISWSLVMLYVMFPGWFVGVVSKSNELIRSVQAKIYESQNETVKDVIHIMMATDDHTMGGLIATVTSVMRHTRNPVMFHFFTNLKSSEHLKVWLTRVPLTSSQYEVMIFNEKLIDGLIKDHEAKENILIYARVFLARLFPNFHKRLIYLDDDIIVQGDIKDLYQIEIKPGHVAAFSEDCSSVSKRLSMVQNTFASFINFNNPEVKESHISPATCSFNTGLFIVNMTAWREKKITEQIEYWMKLNTEKDIYGNQRGGKGPQPPMMLVLYNLYSQVDPLWHVRHLGLMAGTRYSRAFLLKAKLLHWNGYFKPWGRQGAHQDIWQHYYISDPQGKFKLVRKQA